MRRRLIFFAAVAVLVILLCVGGIFLLNRRESFPLRETPEFILPESSQQSTQEAAGIPTEEPTPSAVTAEPTPEQTPGNVLLTSADPENFIRLEFMQEKIYFSGVYSDENITVVSVLREDIRSGDLEYAGDGFSGSVDISRLNGKAGFYIIRFVTQSGSVMDYVFKMTTDGAQPLPEDKLPAQRNLAVAEAPLEIPDETMLKLITASGDRERAADILREVREISDSVCAGLTSELDKARALSHWVSDNLFYDNDAKANGVTDDMLTLEYVLENHRSVCYGWTNLYSALCQAALCQAQGITCYNASGSVVTGSRCFLQTKPEDERGHSWNLLLIGGEKIWVDTVWNSTNIFDNGEYFYGTTDMQYFGITNAALAQDHRAVRCERRDYFGVAEN